VERRARREAAPTDNAETRPGEVATSVGVSWAGLAGGALGFVIMVALAVAVAAGAGDASRWWSLPLVALSAVFAGATWVSFRPFASRELVFRGIVIAVMVLAVVGVPIYGIELPLVLAPPIVLLAQAAGLIFQRNR
jgi:hypothetical protein